MPSWCSALPGAIRLALQITPNASKTRVVGVQGDCLKLRLRAQPIEGKANEALVKWVARSLGVARGAVVITHGVTSRKKLIVVSSAELTVNEVVKLLNVDVA